MKLYKKPNLKYFASLHKILPEKNVLCAAGWKKVIKRRGRNHETKHNRCNRRIFIPTGIIPPVKMYGGS
jgi:hypothetical protein